MLSPDHTHRPPEPGPSPVRIPGPAAAGRPEREIAARKETFARAALNEGNRAQLAAQEDLDRAIHFAVGHLLTHDRELISNAIRAATQET